MQLELKLLVGVICDFVWCLWSSVFCVCVLCVEITPLLGVVGVRLKIIQASCGHNLLKGNFPKV
jgi:hypothetical protein